MSLLHLTLIFYHLTTGLGGIVPQIEFPLNIHSDVIESMISDVLGSITPSALDRAADSIDDAVRLNPLRDSAFNEIFEHIRKEEKGSIGDNWIPDKTGLHRIMAPIGKGPSMWVSKKGEEKFMELGEDAIMRLGSN